MVLPLNVLLGCSRAAAKTYFPNGYVRHPIPPPLRLCLRLLLTLTPSPGPQYLGRLHICHSEPTVHVSGYAASAGPVLLAERPGHDRRRCLWRKRVLVFDQGGLAGRLRQS